MLPVNLPKPSIILTAPEGVSDEQCGSLSAIKGEIEGTPAFQVAYKASKEDMEAIIDGRPVFLHMDIGDSGRWVRISVMQKVTTGTMFCRAITGWLPSCAEVRLLRNGNYVWITIVGETFAPIRVWTCDKEGIANEC